MTKISAYLSGFDEKSQLTRQADAANQRDAWLRQMELAQMSEMGRMGTANASGTNANKAMPSAPWKAILQPQSANTNEDRQHAAAPTLPHSPDGAAQAGTQSAPSDPAPSTSAGDSGSSDGPARETQGATPSTGTTGPQNQPISPSTSGRAQTAPQAASATAGLALTQAAPIATGMPATQAAPIATSIDAAETAPGTVGGLSTPTSPIATGTPTVMAAGDQQDATPTQDEAEQDDVPSADSPLADKPVWQKRLMHMTGEGEDVKLWIRDTELGTTQSQNLVYRLAGDIASMGLRLKDATVNGKLAFRAGDDTDAASGPGARGRARLGAAVRGQGKDTQQASNSIIPTTEEDHGT